MRVVRSTGTPFERGRAVGAALPDDIAASVDDTLRWADGLGADRGRLEDLLAPYDAATERAAPDLAEVLEGMAAGARVDPVGLRATNAFEELYVVLDPAAAAAPVDRCTDAVLPGPDGPLLVHQEQWYAAEADHVAIVIDEPLDGIAVIAPVVASTLPLVGINAAGTAVGAMSLTALDERPGLPRTVVARRVLGATEPATAWREITTEGRAGGYSYTLAFADGTSAVIESTATTAARLDRATHTNHALEATVAAVCPAASAGSRSRLDRIDDLVAGHGIWTVEEAGALLADHGAAGDDICLHPDPADGPEASAIMFGMVADVANRTLWVAPGNPCRHPYEPYAVADLLA